MPSQYNDIVRALGVTAYEIETKADLGKGTVTKGITNRVKPSLETLQKIRDVFPGLDKALEDLPPVEDSPPQNAESKPAKTRKSPQIEDLQAVQRKYIALLEDGQQKIEVLIESTLRAVENSDKLSAQALATVREIQIEIGSQRLAGEAMRRFAIEEIGDLRAKLAMPDLDKRRKKADYTHIAARYHEKTLEVAQEFAHVEEGKLAAQQ